MIQTFLKLKNLFGRSYKRAYKFTRSIRLISGYVQLIHLSPYGEDHSECGNSTLKCKTIDYALNHTDHENITLIFESSSKESLNYTLTKPLHLKGESIALYFHKDDDKGINPTIHGDGKPFIQETKNKRVEIFIESVDFHQLFLISMENSHSKISISIHNSSVYL